MTDQVTIQRHKHVVHLKQFYDRWEVEVTQFPEIIGEESNTPKVTTVTTFTGPGAEHNAREFARRSKSC